MKRVKAVFASKLYLSLVGVLVILVVTLSYLFSQVLDRPLTYSPDEMTVKLRTTGGLFEGSAVTYRGVKVGKVREISIGEEGVEARIVITSKTPIPEDSAAVVRSLSPVGEQYLDFQPFGEDGPYLDDGSVIEADSVDLPLSLGSTVIAVNKLLEQIDDGKVRDVLVELSTALRGTGDDIGSLIDDGSLLLQELEAVWPETERLLENSDVVLDIGTDNEAELTRLAQNAKTLAAFLKDYDPELRRQIQRAPEQIQQVRALVTEAQRVLPEFLSLGVGVTDIFTMYEPHVRALLQNYSPGLRTLLTNYVRDGQLKLKFLLDKDPRCDYGSTRRKPRDVKPHALYRDGNCPASFTTLQRGAAHAPGPVR